MYGAGQYRPEAGPPTSGLPPPQRQLDAGVPARPDSANVTVASGFSGHGFKFVPVVGEILADLATTGITAHSISLFDPDGW
jgi:glycine/D-amino acid oxidase-like deaminating enzyme